ncbi:hypothetical protein F2Q70_00028044 [Brassica cretica]|uniref:UDP-glucuronate decarboxylase n=2 Tax=Brassica cretica TaxID=69181 RepID=A0A8S9LCC5_BRACR|nr:hypothetical protein F2Q70_00028044 [Brassica cretica]
MQMTERGRAMWRTCLASAFRTALACTIVGAATLYGPEWILRYVAFPAFSYVTIILIITDATLGDTLRGCWLALYATCQSVAPAIITLKLIGPARLTAGTTALAAALAAFVVVLPNGSTHLVAKRIALGQIVLIYVIGYINGAETDPVMHPLRVAASTALGVIACVLALLVPLPRLATSEVKQSCKGIGQNVTTRVKLYMKAFCAEDAMTAMASVSQARELSRISSKLYQTIKRYQPSMKWERLPFKIWRWQNVNDNKGEKLQSMEIALRGMDMVLASKSPIPARLLAGEVKDDLKNVQERVILSIKRVNNIPQPSVTPETDLQKPDECLQTLQEVPETPQDLPFYFFLFCLRLLETISTAKPEETKVKPEENNKGSVKTKSRSWFSDWDSKKVMPATKLSLSLASRYGDPLVHPQPETYWGNVNPIGVRSCYDEGKRVAETLMFDYHRQHGIEIRIARIFNTYGPRMNIDDGRVVSNFIAQALRGEALTVQKPGTQTRSFCYVSDMVDGLMRLMEGDQTGPINIGNPGEFTMVELAETVKELIKPDVEIKMVENTPDDPRQRKPDISKAKEVLGWEPKVKLREGLPLMEEDFRLRLGVFKK